MQRTPICRSPRRRRRGKNNRRIRPDRPRAQTHDLRDRAGPDRPRPGDDRASRQATQCLAPSERTRARPNDWIGRHRARESRSSNPAVKIGGVELVAQSLESSVAAEPGLPVDEHSASDLQLDWRFLALDGPENLLVFEVQTTVERAMREYWATHEFLELHSPKLMHSASESGADTFATPYFELGRAYLAQSPQFYKQMAIASGFERVFEIGPVFRAEPSLTPRHAAEFTSVDVEMAWVDSHEDVMRMEEQWLQTSSPRCDRDARRGDRARRSASRCTCRPCRSRG